MSLTVGANSLVPGLTVAHKGSNGISTAMAPDVCKTPSPGGPIPVPYPNIARSSTLSDGTTTVKTDGEMAAIKGSKYASSNGDEAGTAGGVVSSVNMKEAEWVSFSFDVKMEGKNVCRLQDVMTHNKKNTL
jgi:uncharacterized Zn-binding protein involved in type VI secretion